MVSLLGYREIWVVDFEFAAEAGELPRPICLVARELRTQTEKRVWEDELNLMTEPPYSLGADSLFVAYYASAELSCHLALGWPLPARVLDLYAEFRCITNGVRLAYGANLIDAASCFGIDSMSHVEKDSMRRLALRGGPWTPEERVALLEYCASDVALLTRLLNAMLLKIDLPRALFRGRYMAAVAGMERKGIPVDVEVLKLLQSRWPHILGELISSVNQEFEVFDGTIFKQTLFQTYLRSRNIDWPLLESGAPALDKKTFRAMVTRYPEIRPLYELRKTLAQARSIVPEVGSDGRNRTMLSPFRSRTGRNQPSGSRCIYLLPSWLRSLIKPEPGMGLAYIDWSQQEFGIAAALSQDPAMLAAYESGDPYLEFAKQAGAVPPGATKQSHGNIRDMYKQCALATLYGMGYESLARQIGKTPAEARNLLQRHRSTYPTYWRWSDSAVDWAMLHGTIHTVFGWALQVGRDSNPRSLQNYPMQANGAEMLRLACCLMTEQAIHVCVPVHDAVLIEASLEELDNTISLAQECMAQASAVVLGGFRLRSDAKAYRYPDRYIDERGRAMWDLVCRIAGIDEHLLNEEAFHEIMG